MPQRPDSQRDHRSRNLVSAVLSDVWAIEPTKLEQIAAFLEMRAAGLSPSEDEIRASVRMQSRSSFEALADGIDTMAGDRLVVDGVEVLQLMGTMGPRMNMMMEFSGGTSTQKLSQQIERALADPNVKSILLEVDSPGGLMTGTEELRQTILGARGKKQVIAVARGTVASAAYYVATAADKLIATPSTQVGSIGVYSITTDASKAYEQMGVKYQVWRAGDLKFSGNPYEAVTPERAASIQARVDGPYKMFLQAVAENRGVAVATVEKEFGQGTVFLAAEAMRRGMIDRVASIEDVFNELRQQSGITKTPPTSSNQAGFRVSAADISKKEICTMNPKIKAALFALGMTDDVNATDQVCQGVLNGYFRGNVPKGDEAILKGLTQQGTELTTAVATLAEPIKPDGQALAQQKKDQERAELLAAERERSTKIRAKAKLLNGTGFAIDETLVEKAIADGITPAEAADRWTSVAPAGNHGTGENPLGRISAIGSEVDQFHAAASDGLVLRASRQGAISLPKDFKPTAAAEQASRMSAMDIARRDLQLAGHRIDPYGDQEDVAKNWLRMHGEFRIMGEGGVTAANYPNLLSAFMNKSYDTSISLRETNYRQWMGQHPSVPDFNPRLVVGQSDAGYLPEIAGDRDVAPEGNTSEEATAWFATHRRGKTLALTPYMVTQDQLGAFTNQFGLLSLAQDRTIDQMGIDLLVANPTLIDGVALFHLASHGNLPASGGAPSATRARANRLLMRAQPGIGTTEAGELNPAIVLVPDELDEAARQTFYTTERLNEVITKNTDTAINIYRGSITTIISSARLSAASAVVWYELTSQQMAPIKYVYQTGYEGGKRDSWFDPKDQCRYFRHETRLAVFVAGWRGIIKDPGA